MQQFRYSKKSGSRGFIRLTLLIVLPVLVLSPWRQMVGTAASGSAEFSHLTNSSAFDEVAQAEEEADPSCVFQPQDTTSSSDYSDQQVDALLSNVPGGDVSSVNCVSDPYPEFNGIAVDPDNNEVLVSDQNRKSLMIYDRRSGSRSPEMTEPMRRIVGPRTGIGFIAGVAIDPTKREYYTVNNDIEDRMVVFTRDAHGNAVPVRLLYTPHQAWGIALDQQNNELAITSEQLNAVMVYRKDAKGLEAPLRVIKGEGSGMADPHGVFIDPVHNEIVVANHGNYHNDFIRYPYSEKFKPIIPSPGRFQLPSLTIFSRTAKGEQKPLRTIQGPNTQLKLPMGVHEDLVNDEIAVANNGDNSILIFRRTADGDARPVRVIRGPATNIDHPMSVYIDAKNNELWVANFGNHSATVYDRTAKGNAAPKRIIRNAPMGTPTVGLGNPMAVTYDSKREEVLVPN